MGGALTKTNSPRHCGPESKLDAKMVETMQRRALRGTSMKSFNAIIMKFPKIDESLRKFKTIFEKFDEDSNGAIDQDELKHCFQKLEISFDDAEFNDLFLACDIDENMDIIGSNPGKHVYLKHMKKAGSPMCVNFIIHEKSRMGLEELEATFETLVDAFVFLDKNKDGHVSRNEMVHAINETTSGERSSGRIAMKRFEEMDWDKNGMVTFKEFLFAFTRWVGIDEGEEDNED